MLLYMNYLFIELPENMKYCDIYRYRDIKLPISVEDFGHITQPYSLS